MHYTLFQQLLDSQDKMQKECFPDIQKLNQEEQMLINTRALIHETIEVERELNWKHWKKPKPVNDEAVKNEVIDQFIFLMNEINITGMDAEELYYRTMSKINVNIDRQKSGY